MDTNEKLKSFSQTLVLKINEAGTSIGIQQKEKDESIPLRDKDLKPYVSRIIVNDEKKVVVIETPQGKFKTTCDKEDYFDPFVGFCIAFTSSFFGKNKLKKWFGKRMSKLPNKKGNKIIDL